MYKNFEMSKLSNAPLLEVIFEIKWDIETKDDIVDFQYLHGDLYSNIKEYYPYRESLVPPEIPLETFKGNPVYRFRKEKSGYPLIQVGPGLISINILDDTYYWEVFRDSIEYILDVLNNIYHKYSNFKITPALTYIDFFEYHGFETPLSFINQNLELEINDHFMRDFDTNLADINLSFNYDAGGNVISISLRDAIVNDKKNGLACNTKIQGRKKVYGSNQIAKWIDDAHGLSSKIFKSITTNKLYESFK